MTEPINLTQLRQYANVTGLARNNESRLWGGQVVLPATDLVALIDIAEAAHEVGKRSFGQIDARSFYRLREALARTTTNP